MKLEVLDVSWHVNVMLKNPGKVATNLLQLEVNMDSPHSSCGEGSSPSLEVFLLLHPSFRARKVMSVRGTSMTMFVSCLYPV